MATVRALFMDTDGFPKEVLPTADILSALSYLANPASPGDSVFDAGGGKVTNAADGTAALDYVTKQQLDAVSAGLDLKEAVRVATAAALPAYTPAGSGVGKTITIDAAGILTIDGVNTVLGDRILIKDENAGGAHVDHGIYEVTTEGTGLVAAVLTRATDSDGTPVGEVSNGMFVFVDSGTANDKTGWALSTADPITVDTTALDFNQFQGLPTYIGGNGIDITGDTISVDLAADPGLEFSSNQLRVLVNPAGAIERVAAGIGVIVETTNPSLQISANELGVKLDPAGALEKDAGGVQINLEAATPTLEINGSNELGVKLDPAGAVITGAAGVAVQPDNTTIQINGSNQLEVLAAGDANAVKNQYVAATGGVTIGDPVFFSGNGEVDDADAAGGVGTGIQAFGVAMATVIAAASVDIVSEGVAAGVIAGATAGDAYYLAAGGGLTATPPTGNNDRVLMGYAINATDLFVKTQFLGKGRP